jgi:hypothetical protein
VITTLLDHEAAPAGQVRDAYLTRWSAPETTFGEDKTTITGAGTRTAGPVLRSGRPRLVIQEAWAWLTGTQLVRASAAAALRTETAAARALRRQDHALVTADEESFTAVRLTFSAPWNPPRSRPPRHWKRSPPRPTPPPRAALHTLNVPDGSGTPGAPRKHARNSRTPSRPSQPSPGNPRSPCSRPASISSPPRMQAGREGGTAPAAGAADRGATRPTRRDTRTPPMPPRRRHHHETDSRTRTEHERRYAPER